MYCLLCIVATGQLFIRLFASNIKLKMFVSPYSNISWIRLLVNGKINTTFALRF